MQIHRARDSYVRARLWIFMYLWNNAADVYAVME